MANHLRVEPHAVDPDRLVLQTTEHHEFLDIHAGVGVPSGSGETSHFALSVVGLMYDLSIVLLEEFQGNIDETFNAAVSAKDRLMLSSVWIDRRETETYRYFSREDGLREYHSIGKDAKGRIIYKNRAAKWPDYRDRKTTARIRALPAEIASQPLLMLERIRALQEDGILMEFETLTWWVHLQRLPQDRAVRHPRLFAIGAAVHGITKARNRIQGERDAKRQRVRQDS